MRKVVSLALASCFFMLAATSASATVPPLDQESLKRSVLSRIQSVIQSRGGVIANITPAVINIEKVQPVTAGAVTLYAVKMTVRGAGEMPDEMVLLTDQTGQAQFGLVLDLATGEEMALAQARDITSIHIDRSLESVYLEGTGTKTVQFVSDPFCGFCRQAFALLEQQAGAILSLSFIHWPLPMHPGADMAIWFMEYAKEYAPVDVFKAVVKFAYTGLRSPVADPKKDPGDQILEQFFDRFPELLGKLDISQFALRLRGMYQEKTVRIQSEMQQLGISGTPLIIIDGAPINGFDRPEIIKQLNK